MWSVNEQNGIGVGRYMFESSGRENRWRHGGSELVSKEERSLKVALDLEASRSKGAKAPPTPNNSG